jgi:hypothetical protein
LSTDLDPSAGPAAGTVAPTPIEPSVRWNTVRLTVEATTPVLYAAPLKVVHHEVGVRARMALAPSTPVVLFPGNLHSALGRELHRLGGSRLGAAFEQPDRPSMMLLEPPTGPPAMYLSAFEAVAGRFDVGGVLPEDYVAYRPGEPVTFGVCLLGEGARSDRADVARALVMAGKRGVGGRILGERGHFRLVGAVAEKGPAEFPPCPADGVRVRFTAPLVPFLAAPTFAEFWKLARIRLIHHLDVAFGDGFWRRLRFNLDAEAAMETTPLTESCQAWLTHFDFFRSESSKPNVEVGFVGEVAYVGDLRTHWPFLCLGAKLGIGKHTPLGFGRYRLSTLSGHPLDTVPGI